MAKAKIINSYSLGCLKTDLHDEIEHADSQIIVYEDELKGENQHRQHSETIEMLRKSRSDWVLRRDVLHQCLCKIQNYTKEIEI